MIMYDNQSLGILSCCSLLSKLFPSVHSAPGTISGIPEVLEQVSTTESGSLVVWSSPSARRDALSSSCTRASSLCISRWPGTSANASFKSLTADSYCLHSTQRPHSAFYFTATCHEQSRNLNDLETILRLSHAIWQRSSRCTKKFNQSHEGNFILISK